MLIVEDGTGLPGAESYVSIADCQTYATAHGLTFAGTEPEQEAKLRNATTYLDTEYAYTGDRMTDAQALEWPRTVEPGAIPRNIFAACCYLACRPGQLWADVDSAAVTEETIGPLTTKYAAPGNGGQTRFAAVDALVKRWLSGGGSSSIRLVRA